MHPMLSDVSLLWFLYFILQMILLLSKCELSDQNLLDLLLRAEAETLPEMLL